MNGDDLRKLRERRKWSQGDLADAINAALGRNYGSGSVSPWETGKRKIPDDVSTFLDELAISTALPDDPEPDPLAGARGVAADSTPRAGADDVHLPPSQSTTFGGGGAYVKACTELWEIIASGVGMVGAATGSQAMMLDGQIIATDAPALGEAWGRLAEQNETFRKMLLSMTEGGAWLQVALVTGTTVSKCYQGHAQLALEAKATAEANGDLRTAADFAA